MAIYRSGNAYSDTVAGLGLKDAVRRLTPTRRGRGRLKPPPERDAIPASVVSIAPSTSSSGGIVSPLTEDDTSRTYWSQTTATSSDGAFTIVYSPFKTRTFTDANNQTVVFSYPDPSAE